MRGCAGAGSTQARTRTCMSPPPLGVHPCLDLYGLRALSNSDGAPVFIFVLCTCLACPAPSRPRFGVPHSKGDLTGYSPAACRTYRAAHSCLWDWKLCRPPGGLWASSCLACRLRRVRSARRPRAHWFRVGFRVVRFRV